MTSPSPATLETKEFAAYQRFEQLEWLHAKFVTHEFAPHTHEGFAIGVIECGVEAFKYRKALHYAVPGQVLAVNPDEIHTGFAAQTGGWQYRMFYPSADFLGSIASEIGLRGLPFFDQAIWQNPTVAQLLSKAHCALEERAMETSASQLERDTALLEALTALIAQHADTRPVRRPTTPGSSVVAVARAYLDEHALENPSLQHLAGLSGVSAFQLLRAFKRELGLPPHAYLVQRRLEKARGLLRSGVTPIRAAIDTGFSDQAHLTRVFKRAYGITPGVFGKRY
jgi:AraC-like DNA-binding protein